MGCKASKGLTLLELLVVLVLIGVISGLLAPRIGNSVRNTTLKSASQKVAASLRYVRSRAVSEKATYMVQFDFEQARLSILTEKEPPDAKERKDPGNRTEKSARARSYELPEGVHLEKAVLGNGEVHSGLFRVLFFPNGGSSGGKVVLRNDGGRRCEIKIDFITGVVRITDPDHV